MMGWGKKQNQFGTKQTFQANLSYRVMSVQFERVEREGNCVRLGQYEVVLFQAVPFTRIVQSRRLYFVFR